MFYFLYNKYSFYFFNIQNFSKINYSFNMDKKGFVYLICDATNDSYKVGTTKNNIEKRINQLKTGNSNEIFLKDCYESEYYKVIEKLFHRKYKPFNINLEWFDLPNDVIFNFKEICKEIEENHLFLKENNHFYK